MNDHWALEWRSTRADRYDSDMLARARLVVLLHGVTIHGWEGGTDGTTADNALMIEATEPEASQLAVALTTEVGYPVTYRPW